MNTSLGTSHLKRISKYLLDVGYDEFSIQVYTTLTTHGEVNISNLAHLIGTDRTTLYKMLPQLENQGLIEHRLKNKRRLVSAADLDKVMQVVEERFQHYQSLRTQSEEIKTLNNLIRLAPPTAVKHYSGTEGIRHLLLKQLDAKTELLCFSHRIIEEHLGKAFMKRWADEFVKRGLRCRDLYSDSFLQSMKDGDQGIGCDFDGMTQRYLPADVATINHGIDIFDDRVVMFDWVDGKVFAIEIHNAQIANMQRSLFELAWANSEAVPASQHIKLLCA